MAKRKKTSIRTWIGLFIVILVLPLLLINFKKVQQFVIQATGTPANLVIDSNHTLESLDPIWRSFAQGGEESTDMLAPVVAEVKGLGPNHIRIDHIYDHYNVVSRNSQGNLEFNFSRLDQVINTIRKTGAMPFLVLSYMPQVLAENGDITGRPRDWNEWAVVVQKTIEHISGRSGLNLSNVYYEVWNEPDLFGKWKYYGDKNYLTLYTYAVMGAQKAQNTNPYKIGGPATSQLYQNWIKALAQHVTQNNLRLDFFSWHRYSTDPSQYAKDVSQINRWLQPFATLVALPRLITEWGFDSDMNPGHDEDLAAAHSVATIRHALYGYETLFAFELVDGPNPEGTPFWGRWGLLTHPSFGKTIKPRYRAFDLLNQMSGERVLVKGEGTWVTAIAAKEENKLKIILVNYDPYDKHVETVPLQITNLVNGTYDITRTRLGHTTTEEIVEVTESLYSAEFIMPKNSVILLTLTEKETNPFLLEPV